MFWWFPTSSGRPLHVDRSAAAIELTANKVVRDER
jgi:hypothetical protein